jgi:uncharacterized caspase-like protein
MTRHRQLRVDREIGAGAACPVRARRGGPITRYVDDVTSRVESLREQLDRLVAEATAMKHGLTEAAGHWERSEIEQTVSKTLQKRSRKKPTKKEIDETIATLLKPFREHYESWYSEALAVV